MGPLQRVSWNELIDAWFSPLTTSTGAFHEIEKNGRLIRLEGRNAVRDMPPPNPSRVA